MRVRDLDSTNGTWMGATRITEVFVEEVVALDVEVTSPTWAVFDTVEVSCMWKDAVALYGNVVAEMKKLPTDDPLFDKTYVANIQKVTAEQVRDGESIMLDSGTTTLALAQEEFEYKGDFFDIPRMSIRPRPSSR